MAWLGRHVSGGLIACLFLSCFASAFTAVPTVAVTRAAFPPFTALACAAKLCPCVGLGCRVGAQCRFNRAAIGGINRAAFGAFTPFTAAFTPALATFTAAFTGGPFLALLANFAAFVGQTGQGIAAAFAHGFNALAFAEVVLAGWGAAVTAAFAGGAITIGAFGTFTTL